MVARVRTPPLVAVLLVGAMSAGCSAGSVSPSTSDAAPTVSTTATAAPAPIDAEYLPGRSAQVRLPTTAGTAPLVVLVPGGGWQTADPTGLEPLADTLTGAGAATVTITYSTTSTGAIFPVPVDDVACAVRWSAEYATTSGHAPSAVIVLGHSAGGHLAALVGLSGDEFGERARSRRSRSTGSSGLPASTTRHPSRS